MYSRKLRAFIESNPNLIVSRTDAIERGLSVYRSARKCIGGHARPWRWVKTLHGRECISCALGLPTDVAPGRGGRPYSWARRMVTANPRMWISEDDARVLGVPVFRSAGAPCAARGHVNPWRLYGGPQWCLHCRWDLPGDIAPEFARTGPSRKSETRRIVEADPSADVSIGQAAERGLFAFRGSVACNGCGWARPWRHVSGGSCLTCRWELGKE